MVHCFNPDGKRFVSLHWFHGHEDTEDRQKYTVRVNCCQYIFVFMRVLLVLAHPEPASFNAAMFRSAIEALTESGHEVKTSDLYQMKFNPVSDRYNFTTAADPTFLKLQQEEIYATGQNGFIPALEEEMQKVEWCDLMIWQFPLWWFALPAILKGWADRIFAMGRFYGAGQMYATGKCKGKRALLSVTTGGPETAYQPGGLQGDINGILRPIHRGIFEFTGFTVLRPHLTYAVSHVTEVEREAMLESWRDRLKHIDDEPPFEVGLY